MERGELQPIVIPRLEDAENASVDELDQHLLLLEAARRRLDVQWTEALGVSDARKDHNTFGYPSTVAYLKDRFRISGSRSRLYTSMARTARKFQATFASWKHNMISTDQAQLLFQAAERMPDKYPDAEPVLLEIVGDSYQETRQTLDYWKNTVDQADLDVEAQLERRRFDVTRKTNGMVAGSFEMPTLAGETLLTAVDALLPPPVKGDDRSPTQRRADALEDLARSFLDNAQTRQVGRERPHLNVHLDLPALNGEPGGLHETQNGHVLDVATIRQLACDATISRIVFNPTSEIIDVGRKTRTIPPGLRRAVIARDRHCVAPGCDRPPQWCDIHHIISWADGGETILSNLCLLCRYHHTLIHQQQQETGLVLEEVLQQPGTRPP